MKQTKRWLAGFLSLVLLLGLLPTTVLAAEGDTPPGGVEVENYSAFIDALNSTDTTSITITGDVVIPANETLEANVPILVAAQGSLSLEPGAVMTSNVPQGQFWYEDSENTWKHVAEGMEAFLLWKDEEGNCFRALYGTKPNGPDNCSVLADTIHGTLDTAVFRDSFFLYNTTLTVNSLRIIHQDDEAESHQLTVGGGSNLTVTGCLYVEGKLQVGPDSSLTFTDQAAAQNSENWVQGDVEIRGTENNVMNYLNRGGRDDYTHLVGLWYNEDGTVCEDGHDSGIRTTPKDEYEVVFAFQYYEYDPATDSGQWVYDTNIQVSVPDVLSYTQREDGRWILTASDDAWGNSYSVTYNKDGREYAFSVYVQLPNLGYYSAPQVTQDNYINGWDYTPGGDNVFYLGVLPDSWLMNAGTAEGRRFELRYTGDEAHSGDVSWEAVSDGLWKITVSDCDFYAQLEAVALDENDEEQAGFTNGLWIGAAERLLCSETILHAPESDIWNVDYADVSPDSLHSTLSLEAGQSKDVVFYLLVYDGDNQKWVLEFSDADWQKSTDGNVTLQVREDDGNYTTVTAGSQTGTYEIIRLDGDWIENEYVQNDNQRGLPLTVEVTSATPAKGLTRAELAELVYDRFQLAYSGTPTVSFTDIGNCTEAQKLAINALANAGIVNGTSATTFSPETVVTYQVAARVLSSATGSDISDLVSAGVLTQEDAENTDAADTAAVEGWLNGFMTRAELAELVYDRFQLAYSGIPSVSFTDIDLCTEAQQRAINALANAKIVNGTSDTTFNPLGVVTYQAAANILRNATGSEVSDLVSAGVLTQEDTENTDAADAAAVEGWLNGFMTRAELAVLIYDKFQPEDGDTSSFTDIDLCTQEQQTAIKALAKAGILNGTAEDSFQPRGLATCAQAATVLGRATGSEISDLVSAGVLTQEDAENTTAVDAATVESWLSRLPSGDQSITSGEYNYDPTEHLKDETYIATALRKGDGNDGSADLGNAVDDVYVVYKKVNSLEELIAAEADSAVSGVYLAEDIQITGSVTITKAVEIAAGKKLTVASDGKLVSTAPYQRFGYQDIGRAGLANFDRMAGDGVYFLIGTKNGQTYRELYSSGAAAAAALADSSVDWTTAVLAGSAAITGAAKVDNVFLYNSGVLSLTAGASLTTANPLSGISVPSGYQLASSSTSAGYTYSAVPVSSGDDDSDSSSDGGTSSGGSTTTTTERNPDGSTTTTTTNKTTGTVTETTKNTDGSTTTVETKKDGTVTTTDKTADGSTVKTVESPDGSSQTSVKMADGTTASVTVDEEGQTEAEVTVPASVVSGAADSGQAISLPIPAVTASTDSDSAPVVSIDLPRGATAAVEIPVEDAAPGAVAVIVNADGTETVVKKSVVTASGVALTIEGDATVKIIDNSKTFSDVADSSWASGAVDFVSARGLFSGSSDTTFSPDTDMTRGMLAVVLHNLEDNPSHDFDGVFEDVADGAWYTEAIHWAADNGIVSGYGNNMFGAEDPITREQLAVMLWRYAGSPASSHSLDHFTDSHMISAYAYEALAWANENGIINGYGGGILDPGGRATRAQVAQMLMNSLNQ